MAIDALAVRWESLAIVLGAYALAAWALATAGPASPSADAADMRLVLQVSRPGREPQSLEAADGALIGRGRDCTIALDDAAASKWHARLRFDGRRALLEDLESTNGTLVNARRMAAGSTLQLRRGDRISIGNSHVVFVTVARAGDEGE